jgi:hypothetical protein
MRPVWTIGTPDRSSHEFLHGKNNYGSTGSCSGCDDREFYGNWNYWADFASNQRLGEILRDGRRLARTQPTTSDWNYTQWNQFDPGLYDASNDTTDNYVNTIPTTSRVWLAHSGHQRRHHAGSAWYVYFTTTSAAVRARAATSICRSACLA